MNSCFTYDKVMMGDECTYPHTYRHIYDLRPQYCNTRYLRVRKNNNSISNVKLSDVEQVRPVSSGLYEYFFSLLFFVLFLCCAGN